MEPLKDMFNKKTINHISKEIKKKYNGFDSEHFNEDALKGLSSLELKERVLHICTQLHAHLPKNYKKAVKILLLSLGTEQGEEGQGISGFSTWPLNDYVETYGLEHYEVSMNAMCELTKRFSSEFTIRAFIEKYNDRVFSDFEKMTEDPCYHIRRWVSEGTRPLLPWGKKVQCIHDDLERNIPFLTSLFQDEQEYVRRSVANHLNDISKLDKELMLSTCHEFLSLSQSIHTRRLVKHACRTLLKNGNKEALSLNGYDRKIKVEIKQFKISEKEIVEGDSFLLDFSLKSLFKGKEQKLLLEYIIYYPKKNGSYSPKVFRLKDFILKGDEKINISKKIHFKKVTTRKHYPGVHILEIQINGDVLKKTKFKLRF